jgi:TonB family protein
MPFGSAIPMHLADVSLRSLCLAAAAGAAIRLLRVRSPAGRHAVWTLTAAAMLLMAVLQPLFPPLPLRVLAPAERAAPTALAPAAPELAAVVLPAPASAPATPPHRAPIDWRQAAAAIYGAGLLAFAALLASGYVFTRRLVRTSRQVDCLAADNVFESTWIAVPMTVGLVRPKILLPSGWREWPAEKLAAVMAHERTHIDRADWAVAVLAGINRCLFWFHPLAWWLERRLATLAEQACDDEALRETGRRECYAETLLDMIAAVRSGRGRLIWEAMAMARTAEVRTRIERILDETREIPRGWTRARWMAVTACTLPLVYLAVAVQVTPAQEVRLAPETVVQEEQTAPASQIAPDSKSVQPLSQTKEAPPKPEPAPAAEPQESAQPEPTKPESAASPEPQKPVRKDVPGIDMERRLIQRVEPVYPPEAMEAGIQGDVIFETVIGADGHVKSAHPVSGNPRLRAAAQQAVLQYLYRPEPGNGETGTEIESTATVVFRLPVSGTAVPAGRGGSLTPAMLLYRRNPVYPKEAQQMGVKGTVELMAIIGTDGRVKSVHTIGGPEALQQAATDAVTQWVYQPTLLNGVPVENETRISINFASDVVQPNVNRSPQPAPVEAGAATGDAAEVRLRGSETPAPPPSPGSSKPAVLIHHVPPEMPEMARQMGVTGTVELLATIGTDGHVKNVKVLKGPQILQKPAKDAVMQWVYKPTIVDGVPVENETHISINFAQSR